MPYTIASLWELSNGMDIDISVIHWNKKLKTPYNVECDFLNIYKKEEIFYLEEFCNRMRPDYVYVSGRMDKEYLKTSLSLRANGAKIIMGMDTQFKISIKTFIKIILAKKLYHKYFDILWVCGERQRRLANWLGYKNNTIWENIYSGDSNVFVDIEPDYQSKNLLFIGRIDKVKNIEYLCEVFQKVNQDFSDLWTLNVVGVGPKLELLIAKHRKYKKICFHGFQSQVEIVDIIKQSTAFVLPSSHEPYGVVVHESAMCGLPIVCSSRVGASDRFVIHGENGFVFSKDSQLQKYLRLLFSLSHRDLKNMGNKSRELGIQINSQNWLRTFQNAVSN